MEIKNEALRKMLDSASKLKAQKEAEAKNQDKILVENLPTLKEEKPSEMTLSDPESYTPNLSLDPDTPITRDSLLANVGVKQRTFKNGSLESLNKAKRKVGRLTTGSSAAVPLVCKGASCPFKARCVSEDTLVFTPKGYTKIKDLKIRDTIYSFNSEGCLEKDKVLDVFNSGTKETFEIITNYGFKLIVTADHPILTYTDNESMDKTFKSLDSGLELHSAVFIVDNELNVEVDSLDFGDLFEDYIAEINPKGLSTVYDISVEENSNFIANNIAVHNCPYFKEDLHELGEDCLMEEQLVAYWTQKYIDELDIDYNSISEMHLVSRLVEIDILDLRMTNYVSINDQDLMMDFISSADAQGNPLTNKGISVAFDVKERLEKQKLKILDTLNNTRDKKAKLVMNSDKGSSNRETSEALFKKLDKLIDSNRSNRGQIIDAEIIDIK